MSTEPAEPDSQLPSNRSSQPITRRDMLAMSRPDALMLGIAGHDASAKAARLAVATRILREQNQYDEAVYARAVEQWTTVDPDP